MTRNGIEYDLPLSPYIYNYEDDENNVCFYFSSKYNLERYKERYENYVKNEIIKFKAKYNIATYNELYKNLSLSFMIAFYRKIEKRGFYITYINEIGEQCYMNTQDDIINGGVIIEGKISRKTANEVD